MSKYHRASPRLTAEGSGLARDLRKAKEAARKMLLSAVGGGESFMVRVKGFAGGKDDWVALYRSHSQFGRMPIFWVNSRIYQIMEEAGVDPSRAAEVLSDSLLHDVWEWARYRNDEMMSLIAARWGADEEGFAEDFMRHARGDGRSEDLGRIARMFGGDVFGGDAAAGIQSGGG